MTNRESFSAERNFHPDNLVAGCDGDPRPFKGRTVLVVEDDFVIAEDLEFALKQAGAEVVGPAESLPRAIRLFREAKKLDAATLNIDLGGVEVFPLADELLTEGVPILFLTGYGGGHIPDKYSGIRHCDKPIGSARVLEELQGLLRPVPA